MRSLWMISWIFTYPLFKLLTGVEIKGTIPKKGPIIIASNHTSFLDPPLIAYTTFREVYFLAKSNLFEVSRFFRWLITTYNAISIGTTEGLKTAIRLLKQDKVVVIFPEGTRSRTKTMLPFNPGMSYLAISLNVPVVPVYITNSEEKVVSILLRINKIKIRYGKPIMPCGYKKTKEDYEKFANKMREEVERLK